MGLTSPSLYRRVRTFLSRPPDPFLKSPRSLRKAADFLAAFPPPARVLNIGSGISPRRPGIINLDIDRFETVDLLGSALDLPIKDGVLDGVLIQGVLEHVEDPVRAVGEVHRVLKPGRLVYAEIPFMQGYHASPRDFQRYTILGIERLFGGFVLVEKGVQIGPASALAWILREFLAIVLCGKSRWWYTKLLTGFGWIVAPIRYLDLFLDRSHFASQIASAFYYVGKKAS